MYKDEKLPFEKRINGLKEKLNELMKNYDGQVTSELITMSQQLDTLIDEYYQRKYKK
ncbi:aspartyl-phosphate phosphatase Spo0E family protein [Irregularibacter muris]|uniref:Aspartyl-phosphate phosphatase Spo0E family protein n=1 Tax=Irregularibacter muris TaxID=1796619 RepID=A0AAE3HGC5_9FIRM|nr:aspartyl-phosphate phosphatase Spo0E family protein [Irregularibacter muris]MCR1898899.1 aspartyl-phosphate phosphatase Spo0E family protein [Irregularibacter muris]